MAMRIMGTHMVYLHLCMYSFPTVCQASLKHSTAQYLNESKLMSKHMRGNIENTGLN